MKIWGRSLGVCLGVVCLSAAWGQQYTIKTIAGNGTLGNVGSGDAASSQLNSPGAVALAPNGDIYIADTGNHCIRKISGTTISTVAGTCGTIGQSGEGGAATSAYLNAPSGLAFDSGGNLYIADTGNSVIRKIAGTNISRVAGQYNQAGYGGDQGAATSANIDSATAVALDSAGNLYIADTNNNLIRKVDAKTQIITSYVGAGSQTGGTLKAPNGLWFDAAGALYIANSAFNSVSKYVAPTLSLFAGTQTPGVEGDGGPALRAQLGKPSGVMGDASGNIFIADTNNSRIRKVAADGIITTIAGRGTAGGYGGDGGIATDAFLSFPRSIAVASNGTIYVADTGNHAIRMLTPTASTINITGVGNAASFVNRISPGALATIFGTGLANSTFLADDGFTWPTTAKNVTVRVNNVNAPLYYISPGQINFQVPWETPTSGNVNVSVLFNGASSNTVAVPVGTAAPGLFTQADGAAIVQNAVDNSLNTPSNPAAKGSTIVAYLTGSGPVNPAQKNGVPAALSLIYATAPATATIGSTPATVSFTGLTPTFIGLVQMNIIVPASLTPGVYPLVITIDGQTANSATIAVK